MSTTSDGYTKDTPLPILLSRFKTRKKQQNNKEGSGIDDFSHLGIDC